MTENSGASTQFALARETDEHLRLLVEAVRDYAVFMIDPAGFVRSWNTGAEKIKGYTAEQIIGRHFSVFYPPEDVASGKPERLLDLATSEGACQDEGWRLRRDGTRFWGHVTITAVHDEAGALIGFGKVTRDVTESRAAAEALHESEQRFRLLVDGVPDYAIYMLSEDGTIISWNAGAQRIKGYSAAEVLGRHFSMFYPKEDVASGRPQLALETALTSGRYEEEAWRIRKNGARFWANVVITPVRNKDGVLQGFAKVTRDMTERKRAQEQLLASQQLTRELASENRAKDEFLGVVSHELRTPLTVIYGSARFLASHVDRIDATVRRDALDGLVAEAEKFRGLVENLLALAHVDLGESIPLERQSIGEASTRAVDAFRRTAPNRPILVTRPLNPAFALIEPSFFERVVFNLLENADKYSPGGEPVEVATFEGAGMAWLEVRDRGSGVDPAELNLIFSSFYRSPRTSDNVPGKGLGLAVCRRLMEAMNGGIEAEPRDGGGLVLRCSLPLAE